MQQFAQTAQNIAGFGQQNNFSNQPNAMGQINQLHGQMGMPVTNQRNQIGPIGNSLHMGPVNQMNGMTSNAMAMQNQMVRSIIR